MKIIGYTVIAWCIAFVSFYVVNYCPEVFRQLFGHEVGLLDIIGSYVPAFLAGIVTIVAPFILSSKE